MAAEAGAAAEEPAGDSDGALAEVGVLGESVVEKGGWPSVGVLGTLPTICVPIRTVSLIASARAAPEVRSHTAPLWPKGPRSSTGAVRRCPPYEIRTSVPHGSVRLASPTSFGVSFCPHAVVWP